MSISDQLFEGERIRFTAFDSEQDAEVESRWTHDPDYLRLSSPLPARPLSPAQVKKQREAAEKEAKEKRNRFDFAIRLRDEASAERLIGFARLDGIEWNNAHGWIHLAIPDGKDRGQGYGTEALRLILRYAFHELNLHRVSTEVLEYNPRGLRFLEHAGFVVEVRRRQAIARDGRRWDELRLGLLREDWEARR